MVEVGIRELKSRLSYYVQLMRAGETIAIKVRDQVVGFLSKVLSSPVEPRDEKTKRRSRRDVARLLEKWKREGFLISGGLYRHHPFKPVRLKGDLTASELIRKMRDEDL